MKDGHRIVLVEFLGNKPFSVVTMGVGDDRYSHYDFDWCRRDGCFLWHCSGNSLYLEHGDKPYWIIDELAAVIRTGGGEKPTGRRKKKMPKRWPLETLFDGEESEAVYCSICNDWLPANTDTICQHVHWCDKCGWWSGVGADENCEHKEA